MTKLEPSVEIEEYYEDYEPPINATKVTRKLIDNIPQKHLLGLGKIVITNQSSLSQRRLKKKTRSRKRKISMTNVRGRYYHRTSASQAWIEIFIDKFSDLEFGLFQKIPYIRERILAEVLYHEIGHHIHRTSHREYREPEDVADEWRNKLWWDYVRKKYRYWLPLLRLGWKFIYSKPYQRFRNKILQDAIESQMKKESLDTEGSSYR